MLSVTIKAFAFMRKLNLVIFSRQPPALSSVTIDLLRLCRAEWRHEDPRGQLALMIFCRNHRL